MPIQPIRNMGEYKRVKEVLKKRFQSERTGDQELFIEQTKVFKPLINIQKETQKEVKDKILASQEATSSALVSFARELQ